MFVLEQFAVSSSLDLMAGCKKVIANHYDISVPKQVVKSSLKALVELGVLQLPGRVLVGRTVLISWWGAQREKSTLVGKYIIYNT